MQFGYTILYVKDVQETLEFYQSAFGFQQKFITPEKDYGELISGETTIAFASLGLGKSNFRKGFKRVDELPNPVGVEMAFVTEEIEVDLNRALEAGAQQYEALIEKPWGQKVAYVLDNNGFLIELCTPVSAE